MSGEPMGTDGEDGSGDAGIRVDDDLRDVGGDRDDGAHHGDDRGRNDDGYRGRANGDTGPVEGDDAIDDPTLLDGLVSDGNESWTSGDATRNDVREDADAADDDGTHAAAGHGGSSGIGDDRETPAGPDRSRSRARRRANPIVIALIALFVAGLVFAGWTVTRSVLASRGAEHEEALAGCRTARRAYTETATTFTPTLATSKTLLERTRGFDDSETRERLQQQVTATSGIDFAALAAADCSPDMKTADLDALASRYGSADSRMDTALISMNYDARTLKGVLDGLTAKDARTRLAASLDKARTAYSRSEGKADDALRAALQQAIDAGQRTLDTTATTDAGALAAQLDPLDKATDAVIAAMPLDCHFVDCVALTFDDGPNKQRTPKVLDALAKAKVPATFFLQGQFVNGSNVRLVKRMVDEGHSVGSISWRHTQMHAMGADQLSKWFKDTDDVISAASGRPVTLFRPPDGAWSDTLRAAAKDNGQTMIMWNVDSGDWDGKATTSAIAKRVVADAAPGAIVAMHDGNPATAKALPSVIRGLQAKGYHLVTVDTLLAGSLQPVQPGDMAYSLGGIQQDDQGAAITGDQG